MTQRERSLAELRQKVDEIDAEIHDLLMTRARTAVDIGARKGDSPIWRPTREAQMARRLVARHEGPFPKSTLHQIWREIMSAMAGLQGDMTAAVYSPSDSRSCSDLARDHFGVATTLEFHESADAVLKAVLSGRAMIGVLPAPDSCAYPAWWQRLLDIPGPRPNVCARLPFMDSGETGKHAYCVAYMDQEESGDDVTLVVFHTRGDVEKPEIEAILGQTDIKLERLTDTAPLFLAELKGCPDIAAICKQVCTAADTTIIGVSHLGGYPTPLRAD